MDVAQGLYYRVEKNELALRSFNFRVGGGAIYPLAHGSFGGLGFDHCMMRSGEPRSVTHVDSGEACASLVQKLCQSKTTILGELCSETRPSVANAQVFSSFPYP